MLNHVAVFKPLTIGPSSNRSAALFLSRSSSLSTIGVSLDLKLERSRPEPSFVPSFLASFLAVLPMISPTAVFFSRCSSVVSALFEGLNLVMSGSDTYMT